MTAPDPAILVPALFAGLLVAATHVPLGIEVLKRGIVFIDLAIAQIAGTGVIAADWLGFEARGWAVQVSALAAALAGALVLTWSEKRWPEVQEAVIGVAFIAAASVSILLLAGNPHGGEHLRDLLTGQILWVNPGDLAYPAAAYSLILLLWFRLRQRIGMTGFYLLFAWAVTISVQLVGLYLVFATLIVPALATRNFERRRLLLAYLLAAGGYLMGLVISSVTDLPTGALVVCVMTLIGCGVYALAARVRG